MDPLGHPQKLLRATLRFYCFFFLLLVLIFICSEQCYKGYVRLLGLFCEAKFQQEWVAYCVSIGRNNRQL